MSGHHKWTELRDRLFANSTPEQRAAYNRATDELDNAWRVVCAHGCCVWWVSQDSERRDALGGWGPAACPCPCNDIADWEELGR